MSKASDMAAIYKAWYRRLPPAQQAMLAETGFDPSNPGNSGVPMAHRYVETDGGNSADGCDSFRDWKTMQCWSDRGYDVDYVRGAMWQAERAAEEPPMQDKTYEYAEVLDIVRKVIAPWTESQSKDVRLFGTCQYIALGVPGQPTMTELAKRHGVTRAEISRRVKHIQRKMNLPPSIYMKSDHACAKLKRK